MWFFVGIAVGINVINYLLPSPTNETSSSDTSSQEDSESESIESAIDTETSEESTERTVSFRSFWDCDEVVVKFYREYDIVEKTLLQEDAVRFRDLVGVVENYIVNCKDGGQVRNLLYTMFSARNCGRRLSRVFPRAAVPTILEDVYKAIRIAVHESCRYPYQGVYVLEALSQIAELLDDKIEVSMEEMLQAMLEMQAMNL